MNKIYRHTHLKINLDNLIHNVNEIRNFLNKNTTLSAVLKADAYGHGSIEIANALYDNGVNYFLVSTLLEGIELKTYNQNFNVLIMGHTPNEYLNAIVENDLECTIFTLEQAKLLNDLSLKHNKTINIHIKIDTGFNRLGIKINSDTLSIVKEISKLKNLNVIGIFSHLALKNKESDQKQFDQLNLLISRLELENISFKYKHICDSISSVLYPEFQMSMVRIGALIYGLESEERGILNLKQVLSFHTKLSFVKKLKKGESISYGMRWVAKRNSKIGTLPFGYADGYPRNMYQRGFVTINNQKAPIVGVICMDQCMIDLTDIKNLNENDNVIIISDGTNNSMSLDEIALLSQTNKNEIVSRFTKRVPKIYIKNNKILKIKNDLL
ncbi:alanine racemase [Helicovermis profundi]|uniref:Alanine racemase n=1 Tax=Helicovermis profundi TaxID=3065157 RepID=A0AAU9E7K5_9FIRM|nr:alanine racemase [Clostridia bacterium S502]